MVETVCYNAGYFEFKNCEKLSVFYLEPLTFEVFELCNFVVFARPGTEVNPESVIGLKLASRQVYSIEELLQSRAGKIIILNNFEINVSSSLVKERLANDLSVEELLLPEVAEYLTRHKLYN